MISIQEIDDETAARAIREGGIPETLRNPGGLAAVILTQSWCGQWTAMRRYLDEMTREEGAGEEDLQVWFIEYDRKSYFQPFMEFKEASLGNDLVPYIRYYRKGELTGESNYVSRYSFLENLRS